MDSLRAEYEAYRREAHEKHWSAIGFEDWCEITEDRRKDELIERLQAVVKVAQALALQADDFKDEHGNCWICGRIWSSVNQPHRPDCPAKLMQDALARLAQPASDRAGE